MSNEKAEPLKIDRTHWPAGPWMSEPDKVNWTTKAGLPGMIVRNRIGGLCGYVAVTKEHPAYGKGYSSEYETGDDGEPDYSRPKPNPVDSLSVHGGITYASKCAGAICHVPEPGESDDVWWLGFDCVHSGDYHPPSYAGAERHAIPGETYRDIAYVTAEVESLAAQLAEVTP